MEMNSLPPERRRKFSSTPNIHLTASQKMFLSSFFFFTKDTKLAHTVVQGAEDKASL